MSPYQHGLLDFVYKHHHGMLGVFLTKALVESGLLRPPESVQGRKRIMHMACTLNDLESIELLLQEHVLYNEIFDLDRLDAFGTTALGLACFQKDDLALFQSDGDRLDTVARLFDKRLIHRGFISPIGVFKGRAAIEVLLGLFSSLPDRRDKFDIRCADLLLRWHPYVLTPEEHDLIYGEKTRSQFANLGWEE
jgi:hypothetical protein